MDCIFREDSLRWQVQVGQSLCSLSVVLTADADLRESEDGSLGKETLRSGGREERLGEAGGFFLRMEITEELGRSLTLCRPELCRPELCRPELCRPELCTFEL